MDQTNNPIPTPNPAPAPVAPPPAAPVETLVAAPVAPVAPVAPETPVVQPAPVAPVIEPSGVAAPAMPGVAAPVDVPVATPEAPAAVNPVINPAANANIYQPGSDEMLGATDPITMPAPPKMPDPEEEELKAPLKASAPVPGSIGSAISVPAENNQTQTDPMVNTFANNPSERTPSVAFNDPAAEAPVNNMAVAPAKKKMDKKTLYILIAIAAVVVVALIVLLVSMMG